MGGSDIGAQGRDIISNEAVEVASSTVERETAALLTWQTRLLPFVICLLILLSVTFFLLSYKQVSHVEQHIEQEHEFKPEPIQDLLTVDSATRTEDRLAYAQWETVMQLESLALQSRYHQASIATMSRVYIIFLGFTIGMVLALVGATFILAKLREAATRIEGGSSNWRVSVLTSSPGLVFVFLGTVLMIATIWARADIDVKDQSIYLGIGIAEPVPSPAKPATTGSKPGEPIPSREDIIKTLRPPPASEQKAPPANR
jgi:hypothetical protein